MKLTALALSILFSCYALASLGNDFVTNADKVVQNPKDNTLSLVGHAQVIQASHKLTADKIMIDPKKGTVKATGNCIYDDNGKSTSGEKMTFKVASGTWKVQK